MSAVGSYELRYTSNSTTTGSPHTDLVSTPDQPSHDMGFEHCGNGGDQMAGRFARHRVRTIGDVLDTRNKRLTTIKQFADLHPELARQDYARVIAGIPRTIIHHACKQMPRDRPGQWVSTPDGKIGRIESDGAGGSWIRIHRCHIRTGCHSKPRRRSHLSHCTRERRWRTRRLGREGRTRRSHPVAHWPC